VKALSLAVLLSLTAACTTASADVPAAPTLQGQCDAEKARALVGQPASTELAAEAQRLSGAGTVRWLRPGQIITMEYRADRLNIVLDSENRVTEIRCG
jgi:hypothetical protein